MCSDIAIQIDSISKCFQIYDKPRDRLMQMIMRGQKQYFREFWALQNISFEIKKGETVGIVGRNGSGKSTLLQIICGTLTQTSGHVCTQGRVAALLELGSGFNPEFTGRENVYMNASILGLNTREINDRFDSIAAFADIGSFIDQPVKAYSSGMMVRLAFSVAINVDPQILIVDEALSVGDELFQRKCFSRIETIKNNGATILFVSHSGATVVELCDHAILLDSGEKLAMGVPKSIIGKYQKLIYAPPDKQGAIREEIRISGVASQQHTSKPHALSAAPAQEHAVGSAEMEPDEFFDPHLKPQSTLTYESQGAHIECPEIVTMSGKKVNILHRGKTYRYLYKVRFDRSASNVRFGMLIKTASGLELGGAVSAPDFRQAISYQASNTAVNVEFCFTCNLNPGTYFLNAGVTGVIEKEDFFLHRILDFCMFKVVPIKDNTSTGTIDFHCVANIRAADTLSRKNERK